MDRLKQLSQLKTDGQKVKEYLEERYGRTFRDVAEAECFHRENYSLYIEKHCFKIRKNCLVIYSQPFLSGGKGNQALKNESYSGFFNDTSKNRLRDNIDKFLQVVREKTVYDDIRQKKIKVRYVFLTLTIADQVDISTRDTYSLLLRPFLQWLTKYKGVKLYFWKLEKQKDTDFKGNTKEFGGQWHYHITMDNWVNFYDCKAKWNKLQHKAGLLEEYFRKFGNLNPPSIQIHRVRDEKMTNIYLCKAIEKATKSQSERIESEATKSVQNDKKVEGKIWDCSAQLKQMKHLVLKLNGEDKKAFKENIKRAKCQIDKLEWCYIAKSRKDAYNMIPDSLKHSYSIWVNSFTVNNKKTKETTI
jgi:hypothetical protein